MARTEMPDQKLLPHQAAAIIGCSPSYVRYLTNTGRLPSERGTMGIRLLPRDAVASFAAIVVQLGSGVGGSTPSSGSP